MLWDLGQLASEESASSVTWQSSDWPSLPENVTPTPAHDVRSELEGPAPLGAKSIQVRGGDGSWTKPAPAKTPRTVAAQSGEATRAATSTR
jgi:hypothetical protein